MRVTVLGQTSPACQEKVACNGKSKMKPYRERCPTGNAIGAPIRRVRTRKAGDVGCAGRKNNWKAGRVIEADTRLAACLNTMGRDLASQHCKSGATMDYRKFRKIIYQRLEARQRKTGCITHNMAGAGQRKSERKGSAEGSYPSAQTMWSVVPICLWHVR